MHSEHLVPKEADQQMQSSDAMSDEAPPTSRQAMHNIMRVLQPARPPEPRNARLIRRFDLDVAADDPHSEAAAPAPCADKPERQRTRKREEVRAQRNKSLLAAAGFE